MKNKTIALVLAGGSGKRWWPIQTSKIIMPVFGKPLIAYNLERIFSLGFTEVIIVTNPQNRAAIEVLRPPRARIRTVVQEEARGMADAVLEAMPLIGSFPCLIKNALDIFADAFYLQISHELKNKKSFVVAKKNDTYFDGGYYKLKGKRMTGIVEKPGEGNEPSNLTDVVFHYFQNPKVFFDILKKTRSDRDDVYEKALNEYLPNNEADCIVYEGLWLPVKYPWHFLDVVDYLLKEQVTEHRGKNIEIRSQVTIEGPVWIGDNVKIFENAKIVGPCYIGENSIIGNHNLIRTSHIGVNCVTGFSTDITRSYVGDNCWFHHNYVGDSVLEGNVRLGSGAVLANLRLDEGEIYSVVKGERVNTKRNKLGAIIAKNVRVGVNTCIMPGVKIGTHSFIGAGLVVERDIPENSFCYGKGELIMKPNQRRITSGAREHFRKRI